MGHLPEPPKGLSTEAAGLWRTYTTVWELDEHSLVVLRLALECHDRMREAQREIKARGYRPPPRGAPNPFNVERDSRRDIAKLLRSLGLVLDPARDSRA
jgi:hypothetical protein